MTTRRRPRRRLDYSPRRTLRGVTRRELRYSGAPDSSRALSLEPLEDRTLLSADLGPNGLLSILGTDRADTIRLAPGPHDGDVAAFGVPGVQDGTVFAGVAALRVGLLAGHDELKIEPLVLLPNDAIQTPRIGVGGGLGNDVIEIGALLVHDLDVEVKMHEGDDTLNVNAVGAGTPNDNRPPQFNVAVDAGNGDNEIDVQLDGLLHSSSVVIISGDGADVVRSNVFAIWLTVGFFEVNTGGGDDTIKLSSRIGPVTGALAYSIDGGRGENTADVSLGGGSVGPQGSLTLDTIHTEILSLNLTGVDVSGSVVLDHKFVEHGTFVLQDNRIAVGGSMALHSEDVDNLDFSFLGSDVQGFFELTHFCTDISDDVVNVTIADTTLGPQGFFNVEGDSFEGDDVINTTLRAWEQQGTLRYSWLTGGGDDVLNLWGIDQVVAPGGDISIHWDSGPGADQLSKFITNAQVDGKMTSTVESGDGDDVIQTEIVGMRLSGEFLYGSIAGDGNDTINVSDFGGSTLRDGKPAVYSINAGEGDNTSTLTFGDGEPGQTPPTGSSNIRASYRSGNGADSLVTVYTRTGTITPHDVVTKGGHAFRLDASTGGGDDRSKLLIDGVVDAVALNLDFGAGNDTSLRDMGGFIRSLDLNAALGEGNDDSSLVMGGFIQDAKIAIDAGQGDGDDTVKVQSTGGFENILIGLLLGDGHNVADILIETAQAVAGIVPCCRIFVDGGSGVDDVTVDLSGRFEEVLIGLNLGDGDNRAAVNLDAAFVDLDAGIVPSAIVAISTGAGNDVVEAKVITDRDTGAAIRSLLVDLTIDTAAGDDRVKYTMFTPDGTPLRAKVNTTMDTGAGDDTAKLEIRSAAEQFELLADVVTGDGSDVVEVIAAWPTTPCGIVADIGIDTGPGGDRVLVDWMDRLGVDGELDLTLNVAPGGTGFQPEVDDEVLVAFEHGDIRRPYVLGALWNGKDAPPDSPNDALDEQSSPRLKLIVHTAANTPEIDMVMELIGHEGADTLQIQQTNLAFLRQRAFFDTGGGNDEVKVKLKDSRDSEGATLQYNPYVTIDYLMELGVGDDEAEFELELNNDGREALEVDARVQIDGDAGRDKIEAKAEFDGPVAGMLAMKLFGGDDNDRLSLMAKHLSDELKHDLMIDGGKGIDACKASKEVIVRNCER